MTIGAFGNYLLPLMIGARDMAFPRLNALSFWLFLGAGLFIYGGLFMGEAPNAGWFDYVPLALKGYDPGRNIDFYALGLIFNGVASLAAALNFTVTIFKLRAPGMSLNRMPLFCFAMLAVSFSLIFALPALTTDLVFLELQRTLGLHFFDPARGGDPLLWQHLFWIFGHPEVYIIVLPALGIISAIIPPFVRRGMVGYTWIVIAELATALIGFGVWTHHMFVTGLPTIALSFVSLVSFMITIPSGVQVFAWVATLVAGRPVLKPPMLYVLGFILVFVLGGLSGVMFAAVPFDAASHDTYFVVAHFHYVMVGAAIFALFGALYYWLPKMTGRMLHDRAGKWSFWTMFVGFNLAFFPMHILGLLGQPRRTYTYPAHVGWEASNLLSTLGAFLLAVGILVTILNWVWSLRHGEPAGNDPWDGDTLEWATTSPPPAYNFATIPTV